MPDISLANIRRVDGQLLLIMQELLRCGNASEVGRRLHLSQAAVSHALARLRVLFNDQLFVRRAHGLEPTARARELGPRIGALIELMGEAIQVGQNFHAATSSRYFSIAGPEFVSALLGARLATAFRQEAPNSGFAFRQLTQEAAIDELQCGRVDIALGRFEGYSTPGVTAALAWEDSYCVVVAAAHARIRGRISARQFRTEGHVMASSPSEVSRDEARMDYSALRIVSTVPNWLTALTLVRDTDLIATCPTRLAQEQSAPLGLQVLRLPFEVLPIRVTLLRRAGAKDVALDWLCEQLKLAAQPR